VTRQPLQRHLGGTPGYLTYIGDPQITLRMNRPRMQIKTGCDEITPNLTCAETGSKMRPRPASLQATNRDVA